MSPANTIEFNWYDDSDTLYINRTNVSKRTRNADLVPGIVRRIDLETQETVGLIISNASQHLPESLVQEIKKHSYPSMEFFDLLLDMITHSGKVVL